MHALLLVFVCALLAVTSGRTITWTGAAGNSLWGFANNWDVNAVPTSADDIVINPLGGSSVSISSPASALSVTIGGGTYRQTLTLLSSLAVGAGGINVKQSGTLQISTNNDLPLSSTGTVRAQFGSIIVYQSGDITGPGQYIIDLGAGIVFSGPALKLIDKANLTVYGEATIQPTTVQLTRGASIYNLGNVTAIGQITIFANDKGNLVYSNGNFTYQGTVTTSPLTIQVNTTFAGDLTIVSGGVLVEDAAAYNGVVVLPQGSTLTVQAGLAYTWFRSVQGAGTVIVQSPADIANLGVSWVNVADSGSLTLHASSTTKSLTVNGKLVLNSGVTFSATDVSVVAGTVTGAGRLSVSGNFEVAAASTSDINNFIAAEILVAGRGYTTGFVQILFSDAGNLHVLAGATFTISAATTFLKQTGNPVVTNEGSFTIQLPTGSVFSSNVDYQGLSGALVFTGGQAIFQGDKVYAGKVTITTTLVEFRTAEAHLGPVSGTGSVNITAAPGSTSTFGNVQVSYFGVVNGNVNATSLQANTLELFNGALNLAPYATGHTATIFNFYGGQLSGNAQLTSSSLVLSAASPSTISGVKISTRTFKLLPTTVSTAILVQNFASITTTGV